MRERPQTYALTLVCAERLRLFQRAVRAELFLSVLLRYQEEGRFLLHGFVVMPDHVHLVLSPAEAIERAIGLIKGGSSFALRKEYRGPIWQEGYYLHHILNGVDFDGQVKYIADNPRRRQYENYAFVHTRFQELLDPKPSHLGG